MTADQSSAVDQDRRADREAGIVEAIAQVKSGRTIPAEEVEAWIESWDTPGELPMPEPRRR